MPYESCLLVLREISEMKNMYVVSSYSAALDQDAGNATPNVPRPKMKDLNQCIGIKILLTILVCLPQYHANLHSKRAINPVIFGCRISFPGSPT